MMLYHRISMEFSGISRGGSGAEEQSPRGKLNAVFRNTPGPERLYKDTTM